MDSIVDDVGSERKLTLNTFTNYVTSCVMAHTVEPHLKMYDITFDIVGIFQASCTKTKTIAACTKE
jgi:hypothetical protein